MDKWGKYCLAVEKQFKYDVSKILSKEVGDDNALQVMFGANVDYQRIVVPSLCTDAVSDQTFSLRSLRTKLRLPMMYYA